MESIYPSINASASLAEVNETDVDLQRIKDQYKTRFKEILNETVPFHITQWVSTGPKKDLFMIRGFFSLPL